ncbi:uncharacterized protein LOC128262289 [Drosophila gunungcola]|uniref:Uncharacterized protein n=1 Tax=Drosophila gunungcola TaxID=103775 RepID=A0A9Q0BSD2_9MUSC|nr:uncharacterized protein LOC108138169 [Drosophila elegans]XP_052852417.1 uncharacterized protein LOC128262289 [Drosophila gunungcola]KAI8042140.1 hypothetical protein M5D96_003442 [Drosophila gunungcola]
MESHTFVLLLLIGCLIVGCCVAAPQGCNGGFYAKNGNLVLDLKDIQGLLNCVNRQHQQRG